MSVARKKQQWMIVGIVLLIMGLIFFIASNVLGRSPQSILANAGGGRIDTRIVADRTSGASPEDVWISNAEVQIKELGELIGTLRNEVKASEERANQAVSDLAAVIDKRVNTLEGETADAVIDLTSRIDETGERGVADTSREIAEGVELTSLDLGAAPPREFVTGGQGFQPAVLAGQARPVASNTDPVERGPNGQIIELERAPFVTSFTQLCPGTGSYGCGCQDGNREPCQPDPGRSQADWPCSWAF